MIVSDIPYVVSESGSEHAVTFEIECSVENGGVGRYEYWGIHGYDKGADHIVRDSEPVLHMLHSTCMANGVRRYDVGKKRRLAGSNAVIDDLITRYLACNRQYFQTGCWQKTGTLE